MAEEYPMFVKDLHITPEYDSAKVFFTGEEKIVPAKFFTNVKRDACDYDNKVIIGTLLHLAVPNQNGNILSRGVSSRFNSGKNGQNKQQRTMVNSSALILIFGDHFDMPNCFALMMQRKSDFSQSFGASEIARSYGVQVGKPYAIKCPTPSSDYLGNSIVMIKKPEVIVEVVAEGWPKHPMLPSYEGTWQVWFYEEKKTIYVGSMKLLSGEATKLQCKGFTCDMQGGCKGCFGVCLTKKPIVLECTVEVNDVPKWESPNNKALFFDYKSFNFANIFCKDLVSLATKHQAVIDALYVEVRTKVPQMVTYINDHGGWTIVGWHRKGIVTSAETGEEFVSEKTTAHITLLRPTDASVLLDEEFQDLLILTPEDHSVPVLPLAVIHAATTDTTRTTVARAPSDLRQQLLDTASQRNQAPTGRPKTTGEDNSLETGEMFVTHNGQRMYHNGEGVVYRTARADMMDQLDDFHEETCAATNSPAPTPETADV